MYNYTSHYTNLEKLEVMVLMEEAEVMKEVEVEENLQEHPVDYQQNWKMLREN